MAIKPDRTIPGQLSPRDMDAIIALAARVPSDGVVVEVGSLYGLSSWLLAKNAPATARIVCIDPWKHERWMDKVRDHFKTIDLSLATFRANVADCPNIEPIQGYSPECCEGWTTPIDLYFEDAVHANPILGRNVAFWSSHIRPGGVASGHDYTPDYPDVMKEANDLAARWGSKVEAHDAVWWVQRPQ